MKFNKENVSLTAMSIVAVSTSLCMMIIGVKCSDSMMAFFICLVLFMMQERVLQMIKSRILIEPGKKTTPNVIYVLPGNIEMEFPEGMPIPANGDLVFLDDGIFELDKCMHDVHTLQTSVILRKHNR